MLRLTANRVRQALIVALIVGIASFLMAEALPGDAAFNIAGGRYGQDAVDSRAAEHVRRELGLDKPAWSRLATWLGRLATLDLGRSPVTGDRIADALKDTLGHSLVLAIVSLLVALAIAVPIGCLTGFRAGSPIDRIVTGLSIVLRSMPAFLLGVILMVVFAVWLRLLPAAGHDHAGNLVLPSVTLGVLLAAVLLQVVRNAVAEAVSSESFQFARQKGLPFATAFWRHGLRNAAIPVIAYIGVQAVLLLEGVVVAESLFSWPGIGHALTHAVYERDVPMLQGTALTLGLTFVLFTYAIDLICYAIDPRSRP